MQAKTNFFTDNADIDFHLSRRVPFDDLFAWLSNADKDAAGASTPEEYRAVAYEALSTLGAICGDEIAPNAARLEREPITLTDGEVVLPATLKSNLEKLLSFGTQAFGAGPAYGGLGFPILLQATGMELIIRACPSTGLNIVWYSSIAHIIEMFGNETLKDLAIPKLVSGEWSGCMALTEPDAGSDLAGLRSYGTRQPDGSYLLYGSKRFISNGCGQVALVLAMNKKGATGLENLNLYLCLRKLDGNDNYKVTKVEEKVGLHGSATCELNFDGAVAHLLGEENQGFQHMLVLMNDARIGTGFNALGIMEGAYRLAKDYAEQRTTWGKKIAHHELICEKLLDMEVEIKALRSLCYQAAFNLSMTYLGERRLKDSDLSAAERADTAARVAKHKRRVRRWTPLVKWYAGEKSFEHARNGLQVHGGYGFTTEYRAEWWVRESLILSLYEGTSQIQALMCLKDTMKEVVKAPRRFIERMVGLKMKALRETDPLKRKLLQAKQAVDAAIVAILLKVMRANARASFADNSKPTDILKLVRALKHDLVKMENLTDALLHAERLCEMKALTALAECLVWDARAEPERRWIAQRFLAKALPRMTLLKSEIEADEPVIMERLMSFREPEAQLVAKDTHGESQPTAN